MYNVSYDLLITFHQQASQVFLVIFNNCEGYWCVVLRLGGLDPENRLKEEHMDYR